MPHQTHSVVEAATVLGCSPRTIRWHLRAGVLSGVKLGRDWVVWGPLDPADTASSYASQALTCCSWRSSRSELEATLEEFAAMTPPE